MTVLSFCFVECVFASIWAVVGYVVVIRSPTPSNPLTHGIIRAGCGALLGGILLSTESAAYKIQRISGFQFSNTKVETVITMFAISIAVSAIFERTLRRLVAQ